MVHLVKWLVNTVLDMTAMLQVTTHQEGMGVAMAAAPKTMILMTKRKGPKG